MTGTGFFLIVGQDDKAIDVDSVDQVARLFREPWDLMQLKNALYKLVPGEQLLVDGSVVIRLSGLIHEFA